MRDVQRRWHLEAVSGGQVDAAACDGFNEHIRAVYEAWGPVSHVVRQAWRHTLVLMRLVISWWYMAVEWWWWWWWWWWCVSVTVITTDVQRVFGQRTVAETITTRRKMLKCHSVELIPLSTPLILHNVKHRPRQTYAVSCSTARGAGQKIDSFVLTMYKTLLSEWLTCVQNTLQPSFVGLFDIVQ